MSIRSRRAPLLVACAFALAASLSAAADDTKSVAAVPVIVVTAGSASGALTTPEGERMAAEIAVLEKALIQHLKGEVPSSFDALDVRRKELKDRLEDKKLTSADKKLLDDRLARSASIIMRSRRLSGGSPLLDPEISKAIGNTGTVPNPSPAKDPLYLIDKLLGDLDQASANPDQAAKIFDDLNRRYGAPNGATGAVAVNFGAIREKLAVTYTPQGAPGTNAAKARNLGRDTPAPIQEAAVVRAESYDYAALVSLTAGRAAEAIVDKLPNGTARRFVAERSARLKELFDAGRRAASVLGVDPSTFATLDSLVEYLSKEEQGLANSLGLSNKFESMDDVMLRITAVKTANMELGAFMATLWEYRGYLRTNLVKGQVPLNTKFTPWETFPDGNGTTGAQVVGLARGASQFVGLRFDNPDGSSRFQGQAKDGRSGLIVAFDKNKQRSESLVGYDADGKLQSALSDMYDGARLARRERLNMATAIVEIVEYKADGTELKSTRKNTKTGDQFIRDLSGQDGRFEATTKDGRREIRFLASANGAPPAISLRVEKVGTDGSFELERLVLQNGTHIVAKSAHVNQLLEGGTKNLGWEVALKSLVDASDGKQRLTIARGLAHETVTALGMNDDNGRMSKPMGAFLAAEVKNTGDLIDPKNGAPIRFFINENKNYLLIFTRRDGTKRILSGTFKQSTEFEDNKGLGLAFGVSGEIEIDKSGNARQGDPKIVTEYLADGSRLVWLPPSPVKYTPETSLGWLGKHEMWWTNDHEKTEFKVRRDIPPDLARAEWNMDGRSWVSHKDTIDREINGTSVFGTGARWVASVPGVKEVLGVCGDVASTLYTGVVSGGQMIVYEVSGNEDFLLEASAGYSRNPGVRLLIGGMEPDREKDPKAWRAWKDKMNEGFLSRSGGEDNKFVLDVQAKERREKALALQGITERRAPQAYRDAMKAPVSEDERYDALSDFGAGTYGRRLAEDGHEFLGGAMAFGESLGEGLLNPLMYVIPGLGRLAGAAGKVGLSAASPTVQVVTKAAEFGLRGFQYLLLGSVVGSFSLSALDNIGKISDYWGTPGASVKAGEAMADLAFGGLMLHGFGKERTRDRLAELKNLKTETSVADVRLAAVEASVRATEGSLSVMGETGKGGSSQGASGAGEGSVAGAEGSGVKGEVSGESVASNGAKTGLATRLGNFIAKRFADFREKGGDMWKESAPREELRSGDVKPTTQGAANGPAAAVEAKGAELKGADVKTAEIKAPEVQAAEMTAPEVKSAVEAKTSGEVNTTAEVKAVEAKTGEVKLAEVKGEAVKTEAEIKGEANGDLKNEGKDEKRGRANLTEEGKTGAREEVRGEAREEVRSEAKTEVELKDKPGRISRVAKGLGEKGRALGDRAERGSRWIEKRPVMKLARVGIILPITPAMKRNMAEPDADRNRSVKKDPPPPEDKDNEEVQPGQQPPADPPVESSAEPPAGPPSDESRDPRTNTQPKSKRTVKASGDNSSFNPNGGSGGGGGPSGKGPKPPKFGGFGEGGKGGGGGGGPAGNGADGGGGGRDGGGGNGAGPGAARPVVSAEAPANLLGGGGPVIPVSRGLKTAPNDLASTGGHSPAPSLASRYDGSRSKPASNNTWSPSPMTGLGAGDTPGLPRIASRAAAPTAPSSAAGGDIAARTSGGSVAPARAVGGAQGVKPEEEDFSYTYMAPARHKYELPADRPSEEKDWRYLLSLGLRGAAALAIAYLIYHSDLPYLVGFSRRRRDGSYGEK